MSQSVATCEHCGAALSLDDLRGHDCPYCRTVLAHHARAAEQAALVNHMMAQRGLAPVVPYAYGADLPPVYPMSGVQVLVGGGGAVPPGAQPPSSAFPATPDDELQRIVAEGQARQAEFAAKARTLADAAGEDHLAIALGAHQGTALLRAAAVAIGVGLVALAVGLALRETAAADPDVALAVAAGGGALALVSSLVRLGVTPRASASGRAAEEAWRRSLPFALEGYFEALRGEPRASCHVQVHLDWASPRVPPAGLIASFVQRSDPAATAAPGDPSGWVSAPLPGPGGLEGGGRARGNQRLVAYVHGVVEGALLALHAEYPIARVALRRDW